MRFIRGKLFRKYNLIIILSMAHNGHREHTDKRIWIPWLIAFRFYYVLKLNGWPTIRWLFRGCLFVADADIRNSIRVAEEIGSKTNGRIVGVGNDAVGRNQVMTTDGGTLWFMLGVFDKLAYWNATLIYMVTFKFNTAIHCEWFDLKSIALTNLWHRSFEICTSWLMCILLVEN
jgi:hypothetical protein